MFIEMKNYYKNKKDFSKKIILNDDHVSVYS